MTTEHSKHEIEPKDQAWLKQQVDNLTFGKAIWSFRKAEEWTLTDTAAKMGISKQLLSDYEKGRKIPSIKKAYEMATILGMFADTAIRLLINDQLRQLQIPLEVVNLREAS